MLHHRMVFIVHTIQEQPGLKLQGQLYMLVLLLVFINQQMEELLLQTLQLDCLQTRQFPDCQLQLLQQTLPMCIF